MTNNKLSFINTENSFKYSVNIKFDVGNFEKLDSFVPTAKNIKLLREIMKSFRNNAVTRSHMLIGAYGTGKSMLGAVLGTILSNKKQAKKYDKFIEKINRFDNNLAQKIKKEVNEKKPYLLVLPGTENGSFKENMLLALQQALKKNDLDEIFPSTHFDSILNKLKQWENNYPNTYDKFISLLKNRKGQTLDIFKKKIKNFDQESYKFFIKSYPDLTSGGDFNPFYGCNLEEIYKSISREIKKLGYQGIYIIFDEFNKLLETSIGDFNSKKLQDFAEMSTRSEEDEIHLLLISHKKMLQYTSSLPEEQVNEWKKVQKRFRELDAGEYSSQIYELMSNVIVKEESQWKEYKNKYKDKFDLYQKWINDLKIAPDYNEKEKEKFILKGCYPLHPLASVLLPKISQKIAQNERTIFTFLSTEEDNTLCEFIKENKNNEFPLLRVSTIYDYFKNLMQQELDYTNVHGAWSDSQRALQKIGTEENNKKEFIKALGVITAVNNFSEIPPSKKVMRFVLDYLEDDVFNDLIEELIEEKVILYRKSLDNFMFFEGSEIDFNKKINEKKEERKNEFYPKYLLEDYFKPNPIYPKKYNYDYKIRRYFISEFLFINDLENITDWNKYLQEYNDKNYEDGIIAYILAKSQDEIKKATKLAKKVNNKRIIFIIPKKPLRIEELLRNFEAQQLLMEDKKFLSQDSLAEKELNAYISETKNLINQELEKFIEPHYESAYYYNNGEMISGIRSRRNISEKISEICGDKEKGVFNKTPIINNELVVKDKISSPQKGGRKDVIDRLIFNKIEERLGIEGYRPNFLIYRTLLKKTNLIIENDKTNSYELNKEVFTNDSEIKYKVKDNIKEVLQLISEEIYLTDNEVNFKQLYDKLRKPPYGVRLGIIPLLIVIAGRIENDIKYVVIRRNGEEKEINAVLFGKINKYPASFTIERSNWDSVKEEYISFLEKKFEDELESNNSNEVNRLRNIYIAIKSWYQSLPKYARKTKEISKTSLYIRKLINKRTSEVEKMIINKLPEILLEEEINQDNLSLLKDKFNSFIRDHNSAYMNLSNELKIKIKEIFAEETELSFKGALLNWYQNLNTNVKNKTYKREVNTFLNTLRKLEVSEINEDDLLNEITQILTGFEIVDWSDKTVEEFETSIEDIKSRIEKNNKNKRKHNGKDEYGFVLLDKNGEKYKRNFEEVELNGISKVLENRIKSNFDDVGPAISDLEKQQILFNLLKEMFE